MDSNYPKEKMVNDQPLIVYSDELEASGGVIILPEDSDPAIVQRRTSKRRAARVLLTAITFWITYTIFISTYNRRSSGTGCGVFKSERPAASVIGWDIPLDVNVNNCTDWVEDSVTTTDALRGRYSSSTTFELPISSKKLFLMSRGAAAGSLNIVQSDDVGDAAKVQIVATYRYRSALDHTRVCAINRGEDRRGVGIFGPEWSGRVNVNFEITLHLPASSSKSPLQIKNFETDLPLFAHGVGELVNSVNFDTLSLRTSMMPISVGSLSATRARVETSNAKIEGTFNTSSALQLSTSNAPIRVNVGLFNDRGGEATRLNMMTSNAPLTARMSLVSGARYGGQFKVDGTTSLGALDLAFNEAPIGSSLLLHAQSSFAPATVKLHKTYEGEFMLATSMKRTVVTVDDHVEDPTGKGRKRKFNIRQAGTSHVSGSVSWTQGGEILGAVNVETSLAPATLRL